MSSKRVSLLLLGGVLVVAGALAFLSVEEDGGEHQNALITVSTTDHQPDAGPWRCRMSGLPDPRIPSGAIADAYWFLHSQPPSCWSHELQLTPAAAKPSF